MESNESTESPASLLTDELGQKLASLGAGIRVLRNRLAHAAIPDSASPQFAALVAELSRLSSELDHELDVVQHLNQSVGGAGSAAAALEYIRSLDTPFRMLGRRWADLRSAVGIAAAHEIMSRSDVESGWRQRWGALSSHAFDLRPKAAAEPRGASRGLGGNLGLMLDLRYGPELPLAQIAELLNVSPAAVQMRVAEFEESVVGKAVTDAIQEQLTEGWRLLHRSAGSAFLLVRPSEDGRRGAIHVQVLFARDERDSTAGRPRTSTIWVPERGSSRYQDTIWAVVSTESPQVIFLPSVLLRGDTSPSGIIARAREQGMEDVMQAISAEEGGGEEANS